MEEKESMFYINLGNSVVQYKVLKEVPLNFKRTYYAVDVINKRISVLETLTP